MTVVCEDIASLKEVLANFNNKSIGFVPTMGNFHAGHESLFAKSKQDNDITIVSSFVNPTQFNDKKDFVSYPKTFYKDLKVLHKNKVDLLFMPKSEEIYHDDFNFKVTESNFSKTLEGEYRPGHFDGVLTVVLKLFNLVKPNKAYFGEKDYQQLKLITKMAEALFLDIKIIPCPTVRAENGLALSSRNNRLEKNKHALASSFHKLLKSNISIDKIKQNLAESGFKVDYIVEQQGRRLGAIWLDGIRLIDNVKINSGV